MAIEEKAPFKTELRDELTELLEVQRFYEMSARAELGQAGRPAHKLDHAETTFVRERGRGRQPEGFRARVPDRIEGSPAREARDVRGHSKASTGLPSSKLRPLPG